MATGKSNITLTYGLLSGAAGVAFVLILYVMGASTFVSPIAFLGWIVPIVFATMAGIAKKKANGGYLEFSDALKTTFGTFVISSFISTVAMYILLNFIDEPFRQALSQESSIATEKMMKSFGAPQDQIDKAAADALNSNNYSASKMLLGFAFSCILWFIFSLIISAIIKRKKPEFGA